MRKLKLIWDFRGPDALKIAQHHEAHLKDYVKLKQLEPDITGFEAITDMHAMAFMVVTEANMKSVRDALRPHRGQVY